MIYFKRLYKGSWIATKTNKPLDLKESEILMITEFSASSFKVYRVGRYQTAASFKSLSSAFSYAIRTLKERN